MPGRGGESSRRRLFPNRRARTNCHRFLGASVARLNQGSVLRRLCLGADVEGRLHAGSARNALDVALQPGDTGFQVERPGAHIGCELERHDQNDRIGIDVSRKVLVRELLRNRPLVGPAATPGGSCHSIFGRNARRPRIFASKCASAGPCEAARPRAPCLRAVPFPWLRTSRACV